MKIVAAAAALFASTALAGAKYAEPVLSDDHRGLSFRADGHVVAAPIVVPAQEAFGEPQVSPDRASIGWLAYTPGCCTSYPLPTALVIVNDGQVLARYQETTPIWTWAFLDQGRDVAYAMHPPHGRYVVNYRRRRVSDGKIVQAYDCDPDDPDDASGKTAPSWVLEVRFECPASR